MDSRDCPVIPECSLTQEAPHHAAYKKPPPIQIAVLRNISRNFQDAGELTAQVGDIKVFSNRFLCDLLLRNKEVPCPKASRTKLRAKQQVEWPQRPCS